MELGEDGNITSAKAMMLHFTEKDYDDEEEKEEKDKTLKFEQLIIE